MKYVIFHIEGGIGKNILATAVAKAIKKKYPERELIIITAWEDPWFNNPDISRVYRFGTQVYFYDDYIKNKDSIIFMHDPYHCTDYINESDHLIKTWCKLLDIPYNDEQPELFLSSREIDYVRNTVLLGIQKPIFIIQISGGMQDVPYSWARDLPFATAQEIVNHYANDYQILQIKNEKQVLLNNVTACTLPFRQLFAVLLFSQKRLLIDSFAQHASTALGLPSVVTWVVNSPKVLGYDMHENIIAEVEEKYKTTKYSYLSKYNIGGAISEYPYDTRTLFDVNKIYDALSLDKYPHIKHNI